MGVGSAVAFAVERIVDPVEGMHGVVAGRWFGRLGPIGRRAGAAYDAMSRLTYASVRLGTRAVGAGLDAALRVAPATSDGADAWVSGLWGEGHRGGMTVRQRVDERAATGRLVVLLHGLVKNERAWEGTDTRPGLARVLADNPKLTPVLIRYDTGRALKENGAVLADLLEELHESWPVGIDSIALVGHSMGGLVATAACDAAEQAGHEWVRNLTDVVAIGTPYRGAPLEKAVAATARVMGVATTTRPLAQFLDRRSRGIKDLGVAHSSQGHEPSYRHHVIAGVVTADRRHPVGAVVGDLMVRPASGTRPPGPKPTSTVVVGGVNHFGLLHEPAVIDQVMDWLQP